MMRTITPGVIGLCFATQMALAQQGNQDHRDALPILDVQSGIITANDGTFNYQGYLEVDSQPANGMYSFRFEAFEDPGGLDNAHELYFYSELVQVVDGLFNLDVQMGGEASEARRFWREIGNQEMYFEIGVAEFVGGPYTTLDTLSKVGWSARAQFAGIAESIRFPYIDTYADPFADPSIMMSLTHTNGGIVAELVSLGLTDEPTVYIRSEEPLNSLFTAQTGALFVDTPEEEVGLRAQALRFGVVGFHNSPENIAGIQAALVGSVGPNSAPDTVALFASNSSADTSAMLATPSYAGDFRGDIRVSDMPYRDYEPSAAAPIGPIAYGFVNISGNVTNGTANLVARWDPSSSSYKLDISDTDISIGFVTTQVTVIDSNEPRLATTNITGSEIEVTIWDLNSGNIRIQDNFTVVIYQPNATPTARHPSLPAGVDADSFLHANPNFQVPIQIEPAAETDGLIVK